MPYYLGMTNLIDTRQTMLCGAPVFKEKLSVTLGSRFPIIIILILILYVYSLQLPFFVPFLQFSIPILSISALLKLYHVVSYDFLNYSEHTKTNYTFHQRRLILTANEFPLADYMHLDL